MKVEEQHFKRMIYHPLFFYANSTFIVDFILKNKGGRIYEKLEL